MGWLKDLDAPEIQGIADTQVFRIAPPAAHPNAPDKQVDEPSQMPEPVAVVPALSATNSTYRDKGRAGRDRYIRAARIDDPRAESRASPGGPMSCGGKRIRPTRLCKFAVLIH